MVVHFIEEICKLFSAFCFKIEAIALVSEVAKHVKTDSCSRIKATFYEE